MKWIVNKETLDSQYVLPHNVIFIPNVYTQHSGIYECYAELGVFSRYLKIGQARLEMMCELPNPI